MNLLNLQEGMSIEHFKNTVNEISTTALERQQKLEAERHLRMEEGIICQAEKEENIRPLTEQLGSERILRTSTLVPVPPICCTE
jgi:hydrogenase maturation factor